MPDEKKSPKVKPGAKVTLLDPQGNPTFTYLIDNAQIKLKNESTFDGIKKSEKITLSVSGDAVEVK